MVNGAKIDERKDKNNGLKNQTNQQS